MSQAIPLLPSTRRKALEGALSELRTETATSAEEISPHTRKRSRARQGLRRIGALMACVGLTYHCLACLVTAIPRDSRLFARFAPAYHDYARITGAEQYWNMFTNAPHIHQWNAVVDVTDADGGSHSFGPIVPGLKAYDANFIRHATILTRLQNKGNKAYADAYAERLKNEIEARTQIRVKKLTLQINIKRIQAVAAILKTQEVGLDENKTLGPYHWSP